MDLTVGPTDERRAEFRVFAHEGIAGLRDFNLKITGGADVTMPMQVILVPRNTTVAWTADLDGDGQPEWILESPKVRAVFSAQDGGRWMELIWKDTNTNFLPESGLLAEPGAVEIRAAGDTLEITGKNWKRTVTLNGSTLTIEQSAPLPAETLASGKKGNTTLSIDRQSHTKVVIRLDQ
jgi:hypothetical protein